MFVPSTEQDKQDDDDDENILKIHPLACMYRQKLHLHTIEKKFACHTGEHGISARGFFGPEFRPADFSARNFGPM
jgi:hypothetical protein